MSEYTISSDSEMLKEANQSIDLSNHSDIRLTTLELGQRFGLKKETVSNAASKKKDDFPEWSKKRYPQGIGWQRSNEKRGNSWLFIPAQTLNDETN